MRRRPVAGARRAATLPPAAPVGAATKVQIEDDEMLDPGVDE